MAVYRIEIALRDDRLGSSRDATLAAELREVGLDGLQAVRCSRLFFLEGELSRQAAERIAQDLLADPVTESAEVVGTGEQVPEVPGALCVEVHPRPGVMDPVAESTLAELREAGEPVAAVRTARRYVLSGRLEPTRVLTAVGRVLANDCIEEVILGTAGVRPAPVPPVFGFQLRRMPIRDLGDDDLDRLSREAHLFLSRAEMRAIREHFRALGRDPTDLELETIAQTWSEHCVHKTLKSPVVYRGFPLGVPVGSEPIGTTPPIERRYDNLLKDTIVRATRELMDARRGPECLSVFSDNAGVIGFDDRHGVAFKVETHNHPSAIEPYGGAATGIGGCVRDILGCGLGARPIANTDVFCVAPEDWPQEALPQGVLHPRRVLRGVVRGVSDYGNRMGIPTVNGAICFDPRYLGNPLVFCGCAGLIPRDRVTKAARPGDLIVLIGGRTGRDGIHGATFSSAELTDSHADEFAHAVQIGNAITEKRCLDALLQARDDASGCLYDAVTDCGAGGLSSAVGEMGAQVGAVVDLEKVPLKYAGLRYDEIWISEAQERMVLAVPPDTLPRLLEIMRAEEVEATVIGRFSSDADVPRLVVRYDGVVVGDLEMGFLHHGLPRRERRAEWWPAAEAWAAAAPAVGGKRDRPAGVLAELKRLLASPNVASRQWVIRQYDHEVQGGSVLKPLGGPGNGPRDAAVLRPVLGSSRGIALGCGLNPHLSDVDPYWMAVAAIDEALRNVVCVGGDPARTAILDNFCWGNCDDPQQLGALVRACQGCYDAARAYGTPFISGKDSLNNEFALRRDDIPPLLALLRRYVEQSGLPAAGQVGQMIGRRVEQTGRLSIPGTLLISAVSLIDDVASCVSSDFKRPGNAVCLIGALPQTGYALPAAARIHAAVAGALRAGLVVACHDCSEGGWLVAAAEMAIAADRGVELSAADAHWPPAVECCAGYVVETPAPERLEALLAGQGVGLARVGTVGEAADFIWEGQALPVEELRAAWAS